MRTATAQTTPQALSTGSKAPLIVLAWSLTRKTIVRATSRGVMGGAESEGRVWRAWKGLSCRQFYSSCKKAKRITPRGRASRQREKRKGKRTQLACTPPNPTYHCAPTQLHCQYPSQWRPAARRCSGCLRCGNARQHSLWHQPIHSCQHTPLPLFNLLDPHPAENLD